MKNPAEARYRSGCFPDVFLLDIHPGLFQEEVEGLLHLRCRDNDRRPVVVQHTEPTGDVLRMLEIGLKAAPVAEEPSPSRRPVNE